MSNRFPHLQKANEWPGLGTVDPFDLQVTFDPYLWTANTVLHLCNVKLDAEYRNVGGWETKADRDDWFEEWTAEAVTLDTEFHILPGQSIKLPLAFELLNKYNYLYIDFPRTPTVDGNPETERYFYFVTDIEYRSPSATACRIILDEWTTHMHEIEAEYIFLEEGHAPMVAITPHDYLLNPLNNSTLLTIPDVDFGHSDRLQWTAETIINRGPHWLIFSMTSDPFQSPGTIGDPDTWKTPSTHNIINQGALSQSIFAINPADAVTFLSNMDAQAPQLMATVQAAFLIPQRYVDVNGSFTLFGITCRTIEPKQVLEDIITIDETMFGFDSRYAGIAKLYTSPYSWIEITDDNGRRQRLAIEETSGKIKLSVLASVLYPLIGIDAQVTGVGNDGSKPINWDNLSQHTFTFYGDWTQELRHWNIPTFLVSQNAETSYDWSTYWQRYQANETNTRGYSLALDTNSTNLSLRNAALNRQLARLGQQQDHDNQQRTLSQTATNDANEENKRKFQDDWQYDDSIAQVLRANQIQQLALSMNQVHASNALNVTQAAIAEGVAKEYRDYVNVSGQLGMAQSVAGLVSNTAKNLLGASAADTEAYETLMAGGTPGIGTAVAGVNVVSGLAQDTLSIAQSYYDMNYSNYSASAGAASASISLKAAELQAQSVESSIVLNTIQAQQSYDNIRQFSLLKLGNAKRQADELYSINQNLANDSLALQQQFQTDIMNDDVTLTRNQLNTTKALSDRSATQAKDLQDLSLANQRRAARLSPPKVFASISGSATNYTRPQGVFVNIKTQDWGAIAAAGDKFFKYGYRMAGRQWHITEWVPMQKFSYWRGDLQIGSIDNNENTRSTIHAIFEAGVNIWKDPSEIGVTSIYENGIA